ncbi:Signal transduction response regulator, receiver domain [Syntrophomonas zehnderi OL-4]|uniref:Stage 0 sporulation protein A homolog n=1 Tax=Syntrophomonas zehnderi OL-4 TaxID=690567 RepID=A0A0E4GCD3_9FIRM|nr:LytTR family DNA-binding domain-containing protein [Syntrophomonas zehnderi]CFY10920.1 Signal transduction response regulator, receiver domain [Syntrophomonas zehnderi OL-4]
MITVLILEDEEPVRRFIRQLVKENSEVSDIFDTSSGEEAIQLAQQYTPDLILLDIELGSGSFKGLEVAKRIYSFNKEAYMVFVTGYSEYAVDSFEVHPYSYVLKPIHIEKFKALINEIAIKVNEQRVINSDSIVFKFKNQEIHLRKDEIIFVEVQHQISYVHTKNQIWEFRRSLYEIESKLGNRFLRVHRSYLINLSKVLRVVELYDRAYQIEFIDYPKTALMSRYYYPQYKKMTES